MRDRLLPYTNGDADILYGNLLTLPVTDDFMYVQPLYTRRQNESTFPVLTFVLVSYKGNVGIGTTLTAAIEDSLDGSSSSETPTEEPTGTPTESPSASPSETPTSEPTTPAPGGTQAQIRDLLQQAEEKFSQADEAQRNGNSVKWARLMEEGRQLIEEAVQLAG